MSFERTSPSGVSGQCLQGMNTLALIKYLHAAKREGETTADIRIAGQDIIHVSRELSPLILVDGMRYIRTRPVHRNLVLRHFKSTPIPPFPQFGYKLHVNGHQDRKASGRSTST